MLTRPRPLAPSLPPSPRIPFPPPLPRAQAAAHIKAMQERIAAQATAAANAMGERMDAAAAQASQSSLPGGEREREQKRRLSLSRPAVAPLPPGAASVASESSTGGVAGSVGSSGAAEGTESLSVAE